MATGTFWRKPDYTAEDKGDTVEITFHTPGLSIKDVEKKKKENVINFQVYDSGYKLEFRAKLNVGEGRKEKHYLFVIKRLPSKVDAPKSDNNYKLEKNAVVGTLFKVTEENKKPVSWGKAITSGSIDCKESSSSSDEGEYVPTSSIKSPF